MRRVLFLTGVVFSLNVVMGGAEPITAVDADDKERRFNQPGYVSVVIYGTSGLQDWTRQAGEALDVFQGMEDFRGFVVVDLRGYFSLFHGFIKSRMREDMDEEAERIEPFYRKNGNDGDPREGLSATPDFDGSVSRALGWEEKADARRVVIFDREGEEARRWDALEDLSELTRVVRQILEREP